jgi:nuclear transport factor 2 (NTF2) superfamily protein
MSANQNSRPSFPPFTLKTAIQKVRMAEDTRDPGRVSLAYTHDSVWRNRSEFLTGREAIVRFLARKWGQELDYRLIKELWAYHDNRIAVRFAYEWHNDSGNWFRSYGRIQKPTGLCLPKSRGRLERYRTSVRSNRSMT